MEEEGKGSDLSIAGCRRQCAETGGGKEECVSHPGGSSSSCQEEGALASRVFQGGSSGSEGADPQGTFTPRGHPGNAAL